VQLFQATDNVCRFVAELRIAEWSVMCLGKRNIRSQVEEVVQDHGNFRASQGIADAGMGAPAEGQVLLVRGMSMYLRNRPCLFEVAIWILQYFVIGEIIDVFH